MSKQLPHTLTTTNVSSISKFRLQTFWGQITQGNWRGWWKVWTLGLNSDLALRSKITIRVTCSRFRLFDKHIQSWIYIIAECCTQMHIDQASPCYWIEHRSPCSRKVATRKSYILHFITWTAHEGRSFSFLTSGSESLKVPKSDFIKYYLDSP